MDQAETIKRAAILMADAVTALCEVMAMQAENQKRQEQGSRPAYQSDDFLQIIEQYGIHKDNHKKRFKG